jgi:hypothetical protein
MNFMLIKYLKLCPVLYRQLDPTFLRSLAALLVQVQDV